MTFVVFVIKTALEDFRRNKMRTILTSLGILIGVSSVVLLISFGLGLRRYIQQQFDSLGTNTVYILPGNVEGGQMQGAMTSETRFDDKDAQLIRKIEEFSQVVPMYSTYAKLQGDKDSSVYEIAAGDEQMFEVLNIEAEYGSLFTKTDAIKGLKKAVIGPTVARKLFGTEEDAVGKTVKVNELSFRVAGVVESKGGGGMGLPSVDEHVYVPFRSIQSMNPTQTYLAIYAKARSPEEIDIAKEKSREALLKRYKEDEFSVIEQTELLETINTIFGVINIVLVAIAAISLIVGGIGIMNIMFVSVVERIREIGIRRAVGARRIDILALFLTEAVLLSLLGGVIGLLIACGVVALVQPLFPAYIDAATVGIAIGVSSAVGIIFGVVPARRAAQLSPIEAIRYE